MPDQPSGLSTQTPAHKKLNHLQFTTEFVLKRFAVEDEFRRELRIYRLGLPMIPKLLDFQEPLWIKMERVKGWPYLNNPEAIDPGLLGKTLARFHLATCQDGICLCHLDNQPANILYDGSLYHFVDFSDSQLQRPERDLTHLLLFWASDLSHGSLVRLVPEFISAYQAVLPVRTEHWQDELIHSISDFDTRRQEYNKSLHSVSREDFTANRQWLMNPFLA